jgi:prepilin-type N-terminal cleavage/methylation domain-containing protein
MHTAPIPGRTGLTLLEVMVALVILGIVVTGFLETFAGALRSTGQSRASAQALVYAEQEMETIKTGGLEEARAAEVPLGGGFSRSVVVRPWSPGVDRVTVTVTSRDGGRLQLERLVMTP